MPFIRHSEASRARLSGARITEAPDRVTSLDLPPKLNAPPCPIRNGTRAQRRPGLFEATGRCYDACPPAQIQGGASHQADGETETVSALTGGGDSEPARHCCDVHKSHLLRALPRHPKIKGAANQHRPGTEPKPEAAPIVSGGGTAFPVVNLIGGENATPVVTELANEFFGPSMQCIRLVHGTSVAMGALASVRIQRKCSATAAAEGKRS
jgi:hypothetical protein